MNYITKPPHEFTNKVKAGKKSKYFISKSRNERIEEVLNDVTVRTPIKLRDYTPSILVDRGVKNLPMYENPSHIRKNILTENEAKKLGLSIRKNDHYHGLGKNLYIKSIDSLDKPRVIFKNKNTGDYLILTTIKDKNGNNVIVPIKIETTTFINNVDIDTNRIKSVYGFENIKYSLNKYIKHNIRKSVFEKVYEQKKKSSTGNIPQSTSSKNNVS